MRSLEPAIIELLKQRHAGEEPDRVERHSLSSESSPSIERVRLSWLPDGDERYVIKRIYPLGDWIARKTHDERLREYRLFVAGIYRALPPGVATPVIGGVELDGGGVALVMLDISSALVSSDDTRITRTELERSLQSLARLHSAFYGFPARLMAGFGLCTIGGWLTLYSPGTTGNDETLESREQPSNIANGWLAFSQAVPDTWAEIKPLLDDPMPVVRALRECADTVVHGDARAEHFGITREQVMLLDWSQTLRGPGALDLAWFLAVNGPRLPVGQDEAIEIYRAERERLARLPVAGERWERELALSLLAGAMRGGWLKAMQLAGSDAASREKHKAELDFWTRAVAAGRTWL